MQELADPLTQLAGNPALQAAADQYGPSYDCAADAYDHADARLRCLQAATHERLVDRYGTEIAAGTGLAALGGLYTAAKRSLRGERDG